MFPRIGWLVRNGGWIVSYPGIHRTQHIQCVHTFWFANTLKLFLTKENKSSGGRKKKPRIHVHFTVLNWGQPHFRPNKKRHVNSE